MEFRILGPFEVHERDRPLRLTAAKQRTLLAILLLHANEVVPGDRLIDELWGAEPPATAANALQVYVSQVRGVLEPLRAKGAASEVLPARSGGYQLRVEPGTLDAERFERELAAGTAARKAGDARAAAQRLRDALGLWRGAALTDFTYEPFAQTEIARLEELRLVAREERIEADLALGGHAAVVGELEGLVRDHPMRERLRGQLMLALYRCGRQADALEAYQATHRTLMDDLGIAPGKALQDLERAILRQGPELAPPAEAPPPPEPVTATEAPPQPDLEAPAPSEHPGAPPTPPAERRKTVTVLMLGREEQADLDPEARRRLDEHHLEAATALVERHGGTVEGVLGNQLMAVFGVPRAHEDDALRAVRAALEARESESGDLGPGGAPNVRPALRAGIASGEVVAGEEASSGSLTGAPVAIAGGLEDAAAPGEILLAEGTRALLGGAVRAQPAKGADRPAWRLVELASRPPPLSRPPGARIIGREAELAQLRQALDRAAGERTVYLFTVLGAAGIGKSRLAEELASLVAGEATVVAGRCVPYGEGITFWPLREIAGQLIAERPLAEILAGEDDAELLADRISEALVIGEPSISREEIFLSFRRLLQSVARERPLVVVFEDVHWAEPTLLDLVEYLAEREREAPILLLCLARSELLEERHAWGGGKPNASSLLLERLSEAESEELIGTLATGLSETIQARVLEAAEGNPLFLGQFLAMLMEGQPPEGEVPIPATIQALLAARLDRLGPGERAVIDRAAVIGKELWAGAVAGLLPDDARPFASRHLESLVRKDMLSPARSLLRGEEAFRFRHILIQQAAYRAIPKRLRAALHERFAEWLDSNVGGETVEYAEITGYHLEQAYRYRLELGPPGDSERELASRAADRLTLAGHRAFGRGDMPASVNLLRRSASLLPPGDHAGLELLPDLGWALFEVGELDKANDVLTEAIEKGRAWGDSGVEWRATAKLGHVRMFIEPDGMDLESLARDASTAIEALDELGDDLGLARAWILLSDVRWAEGKLVAAGKAAERTAEHARRAGSRREEAWALGAYALCLLHGPTPAAEATRRLERLLREAAGNPILEANLTGFLAPHEAMSGRFDEARAHIAQGRQLTRDLGLEWQVQLHDLLSGYVESLAGDPVAAERDMRAARDAFGTIGDDWWLSTVAVDLPRPVYEQGRYDDALSLVEAIDDVPAPADREWQIKRRGVRAMLLAREKQLEGAESLAREAVALAADSDFLGLHADSLMDFAEVLLLAGRPGEANAAAEEALRLYGEKGNVVSAARTGTLIERLEP